MACELRGNARYSQAQDKTLRDAADELRALLESRGIDADTASPKEIRASVDRYVSEQASGLGYDQSFADGPRGRITFPAAGFSPGPRVIDLFQSRDLRPDERRVGKECVCLLSSTWSPFLYINNIYYSIHNLLLYFSFLFFYFFFFSSLI